MSTVLLPDSYPVFSEIALQKRIVNLLKCDSGTREIVQIYRSQQNVGTLNNLLEGWEHERDFKLKEEAVLRKGESELSVDLFQGVMPDIVLISNRSRQNRIIIEVKQNIKAEPSQCLAYFLHLLVTSDSKPKGVADIPRGMLLAAPSAWFENNSKSSAWHHLVDYFGPLAEQYGIMLGEIRAEDLGDARSNSIPDGRPE